VVLNVHGNDFHDQGQKDLDIIDLRNTTSISSAMAEISQYFSNSERVSGAVGEKIGFCRGCHLKRMIVLWDGEGNPAAERTVLNERNFRDAMKLVKVRKGRDVLRVMFRDEFDPEI